MAHSVFRYNNFNKDNFNPNRHNGKLVEPEKPKLRRVGDWSEQISTAGKKYFYNCKTEVSQWEKPPEWVEYETKHGSFDKHRKLITDDIKSNESSHSASAKPCSSSDFVDEQQRTSFNNDRSSANYGGAKRRYYNKNDNQRYHHRSTTASTSISTADVRNHNYSRNTKNNRSNNDYANSYSDRSNQSDHSNEYRRERWKRDRSPVDRRGHSDVKNMRKRRKIGNGGPSEVDDTDRNDRVEATNSAANNSNEVDLERLPHLLVEIAERHNIDLSDPEVSFPALEKIKQHLKEALSHVVAELPATAQMEVGMEISDTQTILPADVVTTLEIKEDTVPVEVEPPVATLSESHANFYNENLTSHVRNWSSIHFENQAQHLSDRSFQISLDVAQVSADLKCARSLVRTAEIRSTLLEQRISYLRQQHHQLDTLNSKPASSTMSHA